MSLLRAIDTKLTSDVVTVFNKFKTTVFGAMALKTINSVLSISGKLMSFMDAVADTTLVPLMPERDGDYVFSVQGVATPFSVICYYQPKDTDIKQYIGRVNITTGTGASVLRAFKVVTTGTHTGGGTVTLFILTTNATPGNSGPHQTTQVTFADFTGGGTTITLAGAAETSALKRVFKHEEDGTNGGGGTHLLTAGIAMFVDRVNGYLYVLNGTITVYQAYRYKYDVLLTSSSAAGQTTSGFTGANGFKTGNLGTSNPLAATLLQNNTGKWGIPLANSGASAPYLNNPCLFFATTTVLYHGLVSDLAAGVTAWTLGTTNLSGAASDQVNPAALTFANFSVLLGRWVFTANGRYYFKRLVNNEYDMVLGFTDSTFIENQPSKFPNLGSVTVTGLDITDGILTMTSSTVGQRGLLCVDIRNEAKFDYSYFITPVIQLNGDDLMGIQIRNALRGLSSSSQLWIKLSDTLTDFDNPATGWQRLTDDFRLDFDFNSVPIVSKKYAAIKGYNYISKNPTGIAPAIESIRLITKPIASSDDQWVLSSKHTSEPDASPFYIAQRLQFSYMNGMPAELILDVLDDSGNIVQSISTVANAANVTYSTDELVWNPLGTIPNVALTTWVRFLVNNPPDGNVRARLRSV